MSKIEFVLGMLELMGKVSMSDVSLASSMFDRLDSNEDGLISSEEMALALQPNSPSKAAAGSGDGETSY